MSASRRNVPGKEPSLAKRAGVFRGLALGRPLDALSAALSRVRNKSALMVIVVLPAGAFDSSRREFESRLPRPASASARRCSSPRMMRAAGPAYLPSPGRRRSISSTPEASSSGSTKANRILRRWRLPSIEHLVPTPAPRFRPLRLTVSPGDSAPDALFEDDGRNQFALHRFRGRDVLLNFWQSWSAPCLTELGRLQRLHQAGREPPFIVAFHGGKNSDALDEIRKRLGLSFRLVQDSQQRIARRYGVRCWPTTIMVDADGRVEHVQFGIGHGHERPVDEQSKPAGSRA